MDLTAGQFIVHYRLVEKIGEGGMGVVWKADDTKLGRQVAVKILPEEVAGNGQRLIRFETEARLLASLDHPGIVPIHSVEEADGVRFLTMQFVQGKPLTSIIGKHGLPPGKLLPIAIAITDAVSTAHRQGVTHRDLKPANDMIVRRGHARIADFGLAGVADATEQERANRLQESLSMVKDGRDGPPGGSARKEACP